MATNDRPAALQAQAVEPQRSARWRRIVTGCLALYWLGIFAGTHYPREPHIFQAGVSDKWLHFSAYLGLAILLSTLAVLRGRARGWIWPQVVALAALYGAVDELSQPWVGRDCELFDWCADLAGATLGSAAVLLAAARWPRKAADRQRHGRA